MITPKFLIPFWYFLIRIRSLKERIRICNFSTRSDPQYCLSTTIIISPQRLAESSGVEMFKCPICSERVKLKEEARRQVLLLLFTT